MESKTLLNLGDLLKEWGFAYDGHLYRREHLSFVRQGRWLILRDGELRPTSGFRAQDLGQPGLWKRVKDGELIYHVFEIPAWAVREEPETAYGDESGAITLEELLQWALESRDGRVSKTWTPPEADLVSSWLPPNALTLQAKGYVRQCELILNPKRWALSLPILPRITGHLPEARRCALEELVSEARHQWAMVRLDFSQDIIPNSLVAEIDLTGAPPSEVLFLAGLDSLRHMLAWLVETADVLADPSVAIACLAPGRVDTHNPN